MLSNQSYEELNTNLQLVQDNVSGKFLELRALGIGGDALRGLHAELAVRALSWRRHFLTVRQEQAVSPVVTADQEVEYASIYEELSQLYRQLRYKFVPQARILKRIDCDHRRAAISSFKRPGRYKFGSKPASELADVFGEKAGEVISRYIRYAVQANDQMLASLCAMRDIADALNSGEIMRINSLKLSAKKFALQEALLKYLVDQDYLVEA